MKYAGMPWGMWTLFAPSFQKQLTAVFGYSTDRAKTVTKKAKPTYKEIIAGLPEFEKGDRFKMNIVNCALLGAFPSYGRAASSRFASAAIAFRIADSTFSIVYSSHPASHINVLSSSTVSSTSPKISLRSAILRASLS